VTTITSWLFRIARSRTLVGHGRAIIDENQAVTEMLYFNGVNGETGHYGLQPMSAEALVHHVLKDRYSATRQLQDLQRELIDRTLNEQKVLDIVASLVQDVLRPPSQSPDTTADWPNRAARKILAILLGDDASPFIEDVQALAARLAELPQLIGLKNDTNDHEGHAAYLQACGPGFVPITGGMMRPIFWGWDFGARAFADIFTLFRPEISLAFFHHMQRGELAEAAAIMHNYEDVLYPVFRQIGNFKNCAKAGLWLTGHYPTPRMRLPFRAASAEEILKVREVLEMLEIPVVVSP